MTHTTQLRVRYSETDQMGTFYNSRALEWFEVGRTEALRAAGLAYADMESRGVMLPLVTAHVDYLGRAQYDDLLAITTQPAMQGRARMRFDVEIVHAASRAAVARGFTIHAVTDTAGKPTRPPAWLLEAMNDDEPT